MPFINLKTSIGEFPFLIDTGANINLIHPLLAHTCSLTKPYYFKADDIKSANGKFNAKSAIDLNFFYPKINHCAQFLLHDFHPFFHGIIGTAVLIALNAKIDLGNHTLQLSKGSELLTITLLQYSLEPPSTKTSNNIITQGAPHEAQTVCQTNRPEHTYRTSEGTAVKCTDSA